MLSSLPGRLMLPAYAQNLTIDGLAPYSDAQLFDANSSIPLQNFLWRSERMPPAPPASLEA